LKEKKESACLRPINRGLFGKQGLSPNERMIKNITDTMKFASPNIQQFDE
jgi:hypothetical protein